MRDKILVVDDDPAARKLLTLLFQATGEVLAASTGAEALRIIETERPRLMLLDVTMPGMNGLEVLKAARTDATDMTVIMVTGQNDIELAQQALALGATEYVTKPFDLAQLKEKVVRCLKATPKEKRENTGIPWHTADAPPRS
ncbi:MAG: hypothetical protein A2506_05840 [Elusimicrobia bacterium RIFOXYD12_FULL_66_9]|nr:MAG: hypothetical protein A2506_05840 [Elusimicrobia bacterium RIFOXYD12_FULL_66_9]